jgi:hypothetical protein
LFLLRLLAEHYRFRLIIRGEKVKKILLFCVSLFLIFGVYGISFAKDNKEKSLPPGLQKKSERGQSLPPGWQKKLIVGTILENDIYKHGKMIATDNR